jgi:hypothetical protein
MIINNSHDLPNWSQLKNLNEPFATCNVTACINASQAAGWDVMASRKGCADRPADDLFLFIRQSPECIALWHETDPHETIPINQWLTPLALGLSQWLEHPGITFSMTKWEDMRDHIITGGTCVISGRYPTKKNPIDHITALVGIEYSPATGVVDNWIVDDSYGDFRTLYESKVGNDIPMTHYQFMTYAKTQQSNSKRCIYIPKKGA